MQKLPIRLKTNSKFYKYETSPIIDKKSGLMSGVSLIFCVILSDNSGGRISIRVVNVSFLMEFFLMGPLGRSAYVEKAKW